MAGPLTGVRVIEMAGIGPGPYAGMLLADMGAEVIRIDRIGGGAPEGNPTEIASRGKRSIALNLKHPEAVEAVLKLVETADVLTEGFRPGVMEKLGLGPDICLQRNPRLVYGRMTGWGQTGPLAQSAGHDVNYIAITGALAAIGRKDSAPVPPLNLVGDYGGGSLFLVMGVLAALLESKSSGAGQVVDAAISDGVINMMAPNQAYRASGMWELQRESNLLDGGAHFYDTYECADGKYISIGSIEPQFYALLSEKLGIDIGNPGYDTQFDKSQWPVYKARIAELIKTRTREQWCELMEGTDVCFAPVLDMDEAPAYPHNRERECFVEVAGVVQSAPAPRFSRTASEIQGAPCGVGRDTEVLLADLGYDEQQIAALQEDGAVARV